MPEAILITQCLQNDFVSRIGRFDRIPNLLHIGCEEAKRLVGEKPSEGPVSSIVRWAYEQPAEMLRIIHIRDHHDPSDPWQAAHLAKFGNHCIRGTDGAKFVFEGELSSFQSDRAVTIDSLSLNDFVRTNLAELLSPYTGRKLRIGIMGVWTEAKVWFLAYELATRYPEFELAVCSALTASSSRAQHFIALEQLQKILGVKVFASVGQFMSFLVAESVTSPFVVENEQPILTLDGAIQRKPEDRTLVRYLFRGSRSVKGQVLDGGFSGNVVLGTDSIDLHGHQEVGHVVKIGPVESIGRERTAFEQIESVLGNAAPRIVDFADIGERGGLKYRYASMGSGRSTTFQKLYMSGIPLEQVDKLLRTVFVDQLGRLYSAAQLETGNLFAYYAFSPKWAESVQRKVDAVLERAAVEDLIEVAPGEECPNPSKFYQQHLEEILSGYQDSHYSSFVHGDLNGANIIVDSRENVWLIDFFHTHRGHILKDLAKLENDLLYIFTPILNEQDLHEACRLTDHLLTVSDLGVEPAEIDRTQIRNIAIQRAFDTVRLLRAFYPPLIQADRNPLQLMIAQLRYAVHTLGFDESSAWQKKWALYTAGKLTADVLQRVERSQALRIDWVEASELAPGQLGITLLPGRKDYGRDLEHDLRRLNEERVSGVLCLITADELEHYGVERLLAEYQQRGIAVHWLPIVDQGVPTTEEATQAIDWLKGRLAKGERVITHCVGGLGRSGTLVACLLIDLGMDPDRAIEVVRNARSPRAIENREQLEFAKAF